MLRWGEEVSWEGQRQGHLHGLWRKHAQLIDLVLFPGAHQLDGVAHAQLAIHHPEVHNHALHARPGPLTATSGYCSWPMEPARAGPCLHALPDWLSGALCACCAGKPKALTVMHTLLKL